MKTKLNNIKVKKTKTVASARLNNRGQIQVVLENVKLTPK